MAISNYENDKRDVDSKTLIKIADVLRLKPQGYLLKPIDTERLFTTLERVMEGAE